MVVGCVEVVVDAFWMRDSSSSQVEMVVVIFMVMVVMLGVVVMVILVVLCWTRCSSQPVSRHPRQNLPKYRTCRGFLAWVTTDWL